MPHCFLNAFEKADGLSSPTLRAASCSSPEAYSSASLEFDIYISPECTGTLMYNSLGYSAAAVSWCISVSDDAARISVRESEEGLGELVATIPLGEWYTLRIDYTPKNGKTVLYTDSAPKGSSLSYYGKSDGKPPVTKLDGFSFATFKSAKADVYIDNISLSFKQ